MHAPTPSNISNPSPPKGALLTIFLIVFIDLMGFGIVLPILQLYGKRFGISSEFVLVLIGATYSIFQFLFAPILGRWSDRIGRRPVLLISQAGTLAGFLVLFCAHFFETTNPLLGVGLIFASRIIDGISGGNISTASAYIADVTSPQDRAKGMGIIGAAFGIGFIFGPAIGGAVARYGALEYVPLVAALFSATALGLSFFTLKESLQPGQTTPDLRRFTFNTIGRTIARPTIGPLIIMFFVNAFAFAGMEQTLTLLIYDRLYAPAATPQDDLIEKATVGASMLYAFIGVIIALVQGGLIGRLTKKLGERPLVIAGPMFIALGMAIIAFEIPWPWRWLGFVLGCLFLAIGASIFNPSVQAVISKAAGAHEQGEVLGANQGMASLARAVGPILAGILYDFLFPSAPYFASAILCALVAIWATFLMRRPFRQ